jgi:hypothetical protein
MVTKINCLDASISITRASGRGKGPGILKFFGPQMALAYQLDDISQGPKNSRIPGPNPLPLALVMDMHASKTLCIGLYKSYTVNVDCVKFEYVVLAKYHHMLIF